MKKLLLLFNVLCLSLTFMHVKPTAALDVFSQENVSPQTESCIRQIIKEMDMENYSIELRAMNDYAKNSWGTMNAIAYPSFLPRSGLNIIYISQDWFNTLNCQEKRALISHELMHIKNNHTPKKLMVGAACFLASFACAAKLIHTIHPDTFNTKSKQTLKKSFFQVTAGGLGTLFFYMSKPVRNWYSRRCEKEADIQSTQQLHCRQGGVQLWSRFTTQTDDHESPCGTHPQAQERVEYMQEMV